VADFSVIKGRYKALLKKLLPQGWAWDQEPESILDLLTGALASEPARVEQRTDDFLREMDPYQTFEMLDNWERMLGLPDECSPDTYNPGLAERRLRVVQKLTMIGGQSKEFFRQIAASLGYDIDLYDVVNYQDFRVGRSRVGDRLTNSTNPDGSASATGWAYAFQVKAPAEFVRYFKVGQNTVGERLVLAENSSLECIIRKYAPAHTTPIFSYEE
jgi:uncharacterized protein YmfQ (DUF2313 family)